MDCRMPRPALSGSRAGLREAQALWWRRELTAESLHCDERGWTLWTAWIALAFAVPGALLLYLEPLTAPAAVICFAHAWFIPWLQARRGADQIVPLGGRERAGDSRAQRIALGLLGDLLGHRERALLGTTGLVLERGRLGVWLLGERGALLVRPGARRVDCWCVRVADGSELPPADRAAHLLLGLREDELGFGKVANLSFSGACWRLRRRLPPGSRRALDAARETERPERRGSRRSVAVSSTASAGSPAARQV
jgi:hypothetical protein